MGYFPFSKKKKKWGGRRMENSSDKHKLNSKQDNEWHIVCNGTYRAGSHSQIFSCNV